MTDLVEARCCGRAMTVIGVHDRASALQLFSCPSCGRHAWLRDGHPVDRSQLLDTLRVVKEPAARRTPAAPPAPVAPPATVELDEQARREELQRLLAGFSTHGTSS